MKNTILFLIILFIIISQSMYGHAQEPDDNLRNLQIELKEYIKPWQGKITLHYQNLLSDESYAINNDTKMPAASTIMLPSALYVMKLAVMSFVPFRIIQDQIMVQTEREKQVVWNELQTLSYGEVQINDGIISDSTTVAEAEGR